MGYTEKSSGFRKELREVHSSFLINAGMWA
jgi:hypothetical protein